MLEMQKLRFLNDILPLKNQLFRLALRITFDKAEAEDVVQEALIKVWNKRNEWHRLESLEAYCMAVTRNLAIDHNGKKKVQTVELTNEVEVTDNAANPHDRLVTEERVAWVRRLMDQLPEKQRLAVHLRDIEGKNYKEIALTLGQTEEQVKINIFRARQKIRQRISEIENYGL